MLDTIFELIRRRAGDLLLLYESQYSEFAFGEYGSAQQRLWAFLVLVRDRFPHAQVVLTAGSSDKAMKKTRLVIFPRPIVITDRQNLGEIILGCHSNLVLW